MVVIGIFVQLLHHLTYRHFMVEPLYQPEVADSSPYIAQPVLLRNQESRGLPRVIHISSQISAWNL